jgi:hypothetical protein
MELFDSKLYIAQQSSNLIGQYDPSTGAAINASFLTGLGGPAGFTFYNSSLFVANQNAGTIGEYNAFTGATINASLVTGLNSPQNVVVPEPAAWPLLAGTGAALLAVCRRRRAGTGV